VYARTPSVGNLDLHVGAVRSRAVADWRCQFVRFLDLSSRARVSCPENSARGWPGADFRRKGAELESASQRLAATIPIALLLIFVLLYFNFHAVRPAVLIFLNVPLAATGGILALWIRGMPISISAGVGFIALFGIAVLNGIVLLTYVEQLREKGATIESAVEDGAKTRLTLVVLPTIYLWLERRRSRPA